MPSEEPLIKLPKARGEWAELRFMARASENGLTVCKPWGDSRPYDFVVEYDRCMLRVQVKSTMSRRRRGYGCGLRRASTRYTKKDFEFLAVYLIPLDLWYILPSAVAITGRQWLYLCPDFPNSIYEPYREAWFQLKQKRCASHATVDLCYRHGCPARVEYESSAPDS
jgi:PD-(D/E)XK endonuclease